MYAALTTGMDEFFIKNVPKFETGMPEGEHSISNYAIYKEFESLMEDVANVSCRVGALFGQGNSHMYHH